MVGGLAIGVDRLSAGPIIMVDIYHFYNTVSAIFSTDKPIEGGKTRGGGVCAYIRDAWCQDATVVSKHCSPLAEFMIVKCRPFYLPRETSSILLVATYISPTSNISNRNAALNELYQAINEQQTAHPDGFIILAGDFNHADIKPVLPKFHQHVHFPTRGDNILDFVYTQHKEAYKAPPPHWRL